MQRAIDALWPHTGSLFESVWGEGLLEASGVYPRSDERMSVTWHRTIAERAGEGGLTVPASLPKQEGPGGRASQHTPQFEALLTELCEVYRVEPKAAW
jgi:ring-1,2-phenylacetyl-CoA epoxidase subunit PaaC